MYVEVLILTYFYCVQKHFTSGISNFLLFVQENKQETQKKGPKCT